MKTRSMSANMNFMVLDIETDGIGTFRPGRQRPIQVSFLLCDYKGSIITEYSQFVKGVQRIGSPVCPEEWTVEYINTNGLDMRVIVKDIENLLDEHTIIVGHNIIFDIDCIVNMQPSEKISNTPTICTMKQSVNFCKMPRKGRYSTRYGGYKWPSLTELSQCVGIKVDEKKLHDARYDIELTMKSFFELTRRNVITL
tara:strand:- start:213 stop:803 length:591 start_codon:yes stop_codon:yes gene_type:complete